MIIKGFSNNSYIPFSNTNVNTQNQNNAQSKVNKNLDIKNNVSKNLLSKKAELKINFQHMAMKYSHQYIVNGIVSENMHQYKIAQSAYEKAYNWDPSNYQALVRATRINMLA